MKIKSIDIFFVKKLAFALEFLWKAKNMKKIATKGLPWGLSCCIKLIALHKICEGGSKKVLLHKVI